MLWALLWMLGLAIGSAPHRAPAGLDALPWARIGALTPLLLCGPSAGPCLFLIATPGAAYLHESSSRAADARRPRLECADTWSPSRRITRRCAARLRILSWPRPTASGWSAAAVIGAVTPDSTTGDGPSPGEAVMLRGRGAPPRLWERLDCVMDVSAPRQADVQDGFSMARFLRGRGLRWEGRVREDRETEPSADLLETIVSSGVQPTRRWMLDHFEAAYPRREGILLGSVLLGEKGAGLREIRSAFAALGLAHLFAVSGLHIGLVASILLALMVPLRPTPLMRWSVLGAALALYIVLTGMASSSVRAAGLAVVGLSGPLLGARIDSLRLLGLLFWASIVWQPDLGIDSGFRLSYLAAGGIVLVLRLTGPLLKGRGRAVRWLGGSFLVSLGAQWATLPELAAAFGWVNILAPLYNLAAVPLFGAAVTIAFVGMLVSPMRWIGDALAACAWAILRALEVGAARLCDSTLVEGLPAWDRGDLLLYLAGVGGMAACLGLAGRWAGRRRLGGVAACVLMGGAIFALLCREGRPDAMVVHQFDVGQGDCALFRFPDGGTVLVDTGDRWRSGGSPFQMSVVPWLRRHDITRVDAVVLTHHHADHDAAWRSVDAALEVGRWWAVTWRDSLASRLGPDAVVRAPAAGDTIRRGGDWILRCLYPIPGKALPDGENDRSIVLELDHGGKAVGLWMGDLETEGEEILLDSDLRPVQVLKAGHHGSRTSSSRPFLDACRPERVLISCGVENRHSHPSHGSFSAAGGTPVMMRTDIRGTLRLAWDGAGRLRAESARETRVHYDR